MRQLNVFRETIVNSRLGPKFANKKSRAVRINGALFNRILLVEVFFYAVDWMIRLVNLLSIGCILNSLFQD